MRVFKPSLAPSLNILWAACLSVIAATALAQSPGYTTYNFTGATTDPSSSPTKWFDPENWSPQGIPGPADIAVIIGKSVTLDNGTAEVAQLQMLRSATLADPKGTAIGTLTVNTALSLSNSTLGYHIILPTGSQFVISGTSRLSDNAVIDNSGDATAGGTSDLALGSGVTFNNAGSFTFVNDQAVTLKSVSVAPSVFVNTGRLIKDKSKGVTTFSTSIGLTNSGTIQVTAGILSLNGPSTNSEFDQGGTITGAGLLRLDAGLYKMAGTTTVNGNLELGGGVLAGAGSVSGSGGFTWTGGIIGGTLTMAPTPTFRISDSQTGGTKGLGGHLIVLGPTQWDATTQVLASSDAADAIYENWGNLVNTSNAGMTNVSQAAGKTVTFLNRPGATFTKIRADGVTSFGGGILFTNNGTVSLQAGTLAFKENYTQKDGTTRLAGGDLSSPVADIQGGRLDGVGAINGDLKNDGVVSPGSADLGTLAVSGDFTQLKDGILTTRIGDVNGAIVSDILDVKGNSSLDGTLNLTLLPGFVPQFGDLFWIHKYRAHAADFANVTIDNLDPNRAFRRRLDPDGVRMLTGAKAETDVGVNINVQGGDVGMHYANVNEQGDTLIFPDDPTAAGPPPPGIVIPPGSTARDLSTTAQVAGPIVVCLDIPPALQGSPPDSLRFLHQEDGVLVDRTILSTDPLQVCGELPHFSFIVIGKGSPTTPDQKLGDVNDDNTVNVSDAIITLQASAQLITLTGTQEKAADVNKDNKVNVSDAIKILRVAAQVDPPFEE